MNDGASNEHYVSYLLRIWRENCAGESSDKGNEPTWRASVVSTLTGRRQGFANLDDLFDFLRRQDSITLNGHRDRQGEERLNDLDPTAP